MVSNFQICRFQTSQSESYCQIKSYMGLKYVKTPKIEASQHRPTGTSPSSPFPSRNFFQTLWKSVWKPLMRYISFTRQMRKQPERSHWEPQVPQPGTDRTQMKPYGSRFSIHVCLLLLAFFHILPYPSNYHKLCSCCLHSFIFLVSFVIVYFSCRAKLKR